MSDIRILLVEDDPIYRELLRENLAECGYAVMTADTGGEAWRVLEQMGAQLGAVLLDRRLPDMDALDLVSRMKTLPALRTLPIIMQTAMTAPEDVADGLRAGVHYYLTKPYRPEALLNILRAALHSRRELLKLIESLRETDDFIRHIDYLDAWFRTPDDARRLAAMAARVCNDPGRVLLGLSELMINAIEHGNLGIGYEEKGRLIAEDRLVAEVERRLSLPEYKYRKAHLQIERLPGEYEFTIRDEGKGFDWSPYLDFSAERAFHVHGRGIAMARAQSFDALEYRGCGNIVVARIKA